MSEKRWIRVPELQPGDKVEMDTGEGTRVHVAEVRAIRDTPKTRVVTFIVLARGIAVDRRLHKDAEIEVERD